MARKRRTLQNGYKVYKHQELVGFTEGEIRIDPTKVLNAADQGVQTTIVAADGKTVRAIVGLNGTRYLPDPDPDPLDEILRTALAKVASEKV